MKTGILASSDDEFSLDLAKELSDLEVEFLNFGEYLPSEELRFSVIVDRLSYQDPYLLELLKFLSLKGCKVINNPFASSANNKIVCMKFSLDLGIPFPKTIILPKFSEEPEKVLEPNWESVEKEIKLSAFMKPHNGFAWENVHEVKSMAEVRDIYEKLKRQHILLLQEKIDYVDYYRTYCVGKKDVLFIKWGPAPSGLGKYMVSDLKPIENIIDKLTRHTIELNKKLDFDFNVVEWCMDKEGRPFMIDAYNEVPDMDKAAIPAEYYDWILKKLAQHVRRESK